MSAERLRSESGYDARVERVARGFGVGSAGQGVGRLLGYATHATVAWMRGPPARLGFYALGITVLQVASILSQLGMDNGVVRYVAHHGAGGDTARVRGTILQSLGVTLALSLALAALLFAGAGSLAESLFGKPFLATMFRAFAVGLPFLTFMSMALWATQGFGTLKYAALVGQVARPLVNLALLIFFYLLGVQILGAVAAYVALGAVLALACLRRVIPGLLAGKAEYEGRELSAASAPMVVTNVTQYSTLWTAVVVLGVFEPVPTVGVYSAAARTAALSSLVLISFGGVFSPLAASLYRQPAARAGPPLRRCLALGLHRRPRLLPRDGAPRAGRHALFRQGVRLRLARDSGDLRCPALQLLRRPDGPPSGDDGTGEGDHGLDRRLRARGRCAEPDARTPLQRRRRRGRHGRGPRPRQRLIPALRPPQARLLAIRPPVRQTSARRTRRRGDHTVRQTVAPAFEGLLALLLFAPLVRVAFSCVVVSLGLYPSDRRFLASLGVALREALGREPVR